MAFNFVSTVTNRSRLVSRVWHISQSFAEYSATLAEQAGLHGKLVCLSALRDLFTSHQLGLDLHTAVDGRSLHDAIYAAEDSAFFRDLLDQIIAANEITPAELDAVPEILDDTY